MAETSTFGEPTVELEIPRADVTAFVASYALGLLQEIARGTISADVGAFTLALPRIVEPLETMGVPAELITVLRTCDELSAIKDSMAAKFESTVAALIERVRRVLASVEQPAFRLEWRTPSST